MKFLKLSTLSTSFNARFKTTLAGHDFVSEIYCEDTSSLVDAQLTLASQSVEVSLAAVLIYFEFLQGHESYIPDEFSEDILSSLCQELGVDAEAYENSTMGSYDVFTNRVTPANMGNIFPDCTYRVVWDSAKTSIDFDTVLRILSGALSALGEMQGLVVFQPTEDELDDNNTTAVTNRRLDALHRAGFWPNDDSTFPDADSLPDLNTVLNKFVHPNDA